MKFKDILVFIDDSDRSKALLSYSIDFAKQHNAELSCLYIYDWTRHVKKTVETEQWPYSSVTTIEKRNEEELKEWFNESIDKGNIKVNWYREEGEIVTYLNTYAHYFDLVFLNQPSSRLTHNVLLNSGRPMLVIPDHYTDKALGGKILIAWCVNRKEAARAINDSIPLLLQAEKIDVVEGFDENNLSIKIEKDKLGILNHLSKHGIKAKMHQFSELPESIGELVIKQAKSYQSDLIVMGGYGHTRFGEIILGGATRYILKNTTIPIFLSH